MTYTKVAKREMTPSPWQGELVCIPIEAIPHALTALEIKARKYYWQSDDDAKNGRQVLAEMGANMLLGCGGEIVQRLNLLYMQQDNIHNGQNYSYDVDEETGEIIYSPPIPIVPPNTALYNHPGTRYWQEDTRDALLNAITGATSADYPNPRGTNPILEEILTALSAASEEEQLEILRAILTALGGVVV